MLRLEALRRKGEGLLLPSRLRHLKLEETSSGDFLAGIEDFQRNNLIFVRYVEDTLGSFLSDKRFQEVGRAKDSYALVFLERQDVFFVPGD